MLMVIYIRENGKMEKQMGMVFLLTPTDLCTKVNGARTSNMVRVQNHGILIRLNIQVIL